MRVHSRSSLRVAVLTVAALVVLVSVPSTAPGQVELVDHFKCYDVDEEESTALDPAPVVNLIDQFGVEPEVLVGDPEFFCNPVDKDGEGILNAEAHLTCYDIGDDDDDQVRTVLVTNQFGDQTLTVTGPEILCVPPEVEVELECPIVPPGFTGATPPGVCKTCIRDITDCEIICATAPPTASLYACALIAAGFEGSDNLDHYKCYEAEGDSVDVIVDLQDQFGVEPEVLVGEPELFCNPVDKNGEGIFHAEAHLTCYDIGDDEEERDVLVTNQFGEQTLEVEDPELLCVPSEKIAVEPH